MAYVEIYVPERPELVALLKLAFPNEQREQLIPRMDLLMRCYAALQAHSHYWLTERTVRRSEALAIANGQQWALDALCLPLPNRPSLLHDGSAPCGTAAASCVFTDCLDPCLGEECVCRHPEQLAQSDYKLCLLG